MAVSPETKLSREDEARLALEHTVISFSMAWLIVALFLLTIVAVPFAQSVFEINRNRAEKREIIAPQSWDVWKLRPTREKLWPSVSEIKDYESDLEDESIVSQWLLPRVQYLLTNYLGAGNEQVYVGREGWLHYRPDVDYVSSPGFLDPALLTARRRSGDEGDALVQPDPIRAIIDFRDQLKSCGITLIVMPMPVKTMVEPQQLSARYGSTPALLKNPSQPAFLQELKSRGVMVFDPSPILIEARNQSGQAQYLKTDTHWTPPAMQNVARGLAQFIESGVLPRAGTNAYMHQARATTNTGDIAAMLTLPDNHPLFEKQTVTIQQVQTPDGKLWQPQRNVEVLLLGDSFCNIYSLPGMGWGESAGFGPQLSFYLRRPLDTIIINAGGSHTSRQKLAGDLARGRDRLKNVKLVVWQFAVRDLLIGDWKTFELSKERNHR